jgi:hypothetical protein
MNMAATSRLSWLFNRLRCMPPGEIGYRLRQAALHALEKRGLAGPVAAAAPSRRAQMSTPLLPHGVLPLAPQERAALLDDADRILAGEVVLFASARFTVGAPPRWNRDPSTGVEGPALFARDLAITNRALVGDIKHVWELNRHLHLVRLAQAWAASGSQVYAQGLALQLRSWLDQCPPMTGPNWSSSLEMGIRLINWALIWQLQGGYEGVLFAGPGGDALRRDWLASIHAHSHAIARHLSRHSSANNHLIGELAGLYAAASTWPYWSESPRWLEQARRELEREAIAQYSGDGVNREQAFAYHVFSAEFLFVAGMLGQACRRPFSLAYWGALQHALRFLRSVRDAGGHVPMVGDADDGVVYRLDPTCNDRAALLLALGAALQAGGPPVTTSPTVRWLRHAWDGPLPQVEPLEAELGWAFPDGGYLLFGSDWGTAREVKGMLDCGPLGYLGIAAHGHADALAITLSVAGEECLVDPGTYSYWQDQQWRDYFRGTSAHNTVRVDGLDQSVSGGRFMWLRKARVAIERMPNSPTLFDFRGAHDGYARLPDPVRHVRSLQFDERAQALTVTDEIVAKQAHQVEQFWHFAPALALTLDGHTLTVRGRAFAMELNVAGAGLSMELLCGMENPPLGWISRSYETKSPCSVLKITTLSSSVPIQCRFTITFPQLN